METGIFILTGLLGLVSNWAVKWSKKECCKTFTDYMINNKRYTIASISVMITGVMALTGNEITQQAMSIAFLTGYSADSAINR